MSWRFTSLFVVAMWCCGFAPETSSKYPRVAPLERVINVPSVQRADVNVIIKTARGRAVYKIACHSSNYSSDVGFEYSGDFECRMTTIGLVTKYSTLLTENPNQSRDWESRARFFSADLQGQCASIPEFGSTRDFRLRGMIVTLQVLQPAFGPNGVLDSLKLKVAVQPDPSARRPIAAAEPFPISPPTQCKIEQYFPAANYSDRIQAR